MRARIVVSGMVQGVGYRNFIKRKATEMGVRGWVRNLDSGSVEALLVGEKDVLESLAEECRRGPPFSKVTNLDLKWEEGDNSFESFSID